MKWMKSFSILIFLSIISPLTVQAQEGNVPYSVGAVLPENQINDDATYFDIEMEQGQSQDLEITVYNSSDDPITVSVNNHFAATNSNGIITYDGSIEEPDESMSYPFDEISSIDENEVEVEPLSQETVTVNVTAPDESFDGVILGGLYFTMEPESSEEESGLEIQNSYSYALAVQIRETNNDTSVEPELELDEVHPGIVNHRTGLQTQFVNSTPVIIGELEFTGSVYESGSEEPLYTRTDENFTIAPNTKFNYPIMYDNQRLEPGDYIFQATASNNSHEWEFKENFEITEDEADEANETAVELDEDYSWLIYIVIILGIVILLLMIAVFYLFLKRKK